MSGPATSAPELQRTTAAELMQSAPLATNTALAVYSDYNLGLRVPTNVRLSWRDTQADTVLADALKAIVDGCGVVGDRVPRPFANYDWTHYSDEIGSLFAYFWILLFSVQYAAVQGSGNDIRKAWRFFRIQTKQWFERAGFFATEWMDGAVRKLDSAAAVDRFDAQLRALQTAYLSARPQRVKAARESETYQEQLRTVQAYDAEIAELAALSSVEIVENQPKLDVLQQIVRLQRDEAVQKRDRLMQTMPLPESLLTGLRRLIVPSVAPKKFLDEIGTLKAEAIVAKSTIKNLEQRLDESKLAKANDVLQKEVTALRQQLADSAAKVASADKLQQMRADLAAASSNLASTGAAIGSISPATLAALRAAAPTPGRTINAATQRILDDYSRMQAESAVEKGTIRELQQRLDTSKMARDNNSLRQQVGDLQQKLTDCQNNNTSADQLRKTRDELKQVSTTLAETVSVRAIAPDALAALRAAAPKPGRTIDAATQRILDDYNRLKVEAAMEKANIQELQKRLNKYNEDAEIVRLRAQIADLQQKLFKCQENADPKELRKVHDELKNASTTLAAQISEATLSPGMLDRLRAAAPKPGRTIDEATQRILDSYGKLKVEMTIRENTIAELERRLKASSLIKEVDSLREYNDKLRQQLAEYVTKAAFAESSAQLSTELRAASATLAAAGAAAGTISASTLAALRATAPTPGRTIDAATQRILDSYGEMQVKLRIQESTIAELQRSLSGSKLTTEINDLRKKLAECTAKTASAESSAKLLNELRTASATLAATGAVAGLIDPTLLAALRQTVPTRPPPPGTTPQLVEAYGKLKAEASVQKATISELERRLTEMKESKESALQKAADYCRQRLTEYELNAIDDVQRRALLDNLVKASEFFADNVAQSALPPDMLRALRAAEPSERLVAAYEEIIKKLRLDIGEREAKLIVKDSTIKELRKQLSPSLTSAPSLPGTVALSPPAPPGTVATSSSALTSTVAPKRM